MAWKTYSPDTDFDVDLGVCTSCQRVYDLRLYRRDSLCAQCVAAAAVVEILALEDLDSAGARIEQARAKAATLPPDERAKVEAELLFLSRELAAQVQNERRRRA